MLPSFDLTIDGDVSKVTPEDMIKVVNGFIALTKSYNKLGLALEHAGLTASSPAGKYLIETELLNFNNAMKTYALLFNNLSFSTME